ncbi:MAG: protein-L-isoaspartate(D-aspartate) O-methyltransferase [Pseudomonadales bacterium]
MTSQRTRVRLVERLRERGITDEGLLEIISMTPRHLFIDEALAHRAYEDTSLPIGYQQTISQPYVVARMTQALLSDGPLKRVLEVGTGSGYQTAILAQVVERVFTVERIQGLLERAREHLKLVGLRNVQFRHADGGVGWPEKGPFDGIIVTASPRRIPAELIEQLAEGGKMVVPLDNGNGQELVLIRADAGVIGTQVLEKVNFVPMVGGKV